LVNLVGAVLADFPDKGRFKGNFTCIAEFPANLMRFMHVNSGTWQ